MKNEKMPELGAKYKKYYFVIEDGEVTFKKSEITVTDSVGQHTVRYSERFEDGRECVNLRSVRSGHPWEDAVIVSPHGISVITTGNKSKAKRLVAAYYAAQRKKHEKAIAKIDQNAFLVKKA